GRHPQEGQAVFLVGWGVHGDEIAAVLEPGAQVAAEARVLGCRGEREGRVRKARTKPLLQRGEPRIHCDLRRIVPLFTLKRGLQLLPKMRHFPARVAALPLLFFCAQLAWPQARLPAPPKPQTPTTIEAEKIEGNPDLEVTARG